MVDKVKQELLALADASTGMIHCDSVERWARNHEGSALYARLEWDDSKAGYQWRLHQIRGLVQLHIVAEDRTPQYVSLQIDRGTGGGYRPLDKVLSSRDLSEALLKDALSELERVRLKYGRVQALVSVWDEVDRVAKEKPSRGRRRSGGRRGRGAEGGEARP